MDLINIDNPIIIISNSALDKQVLRCFPSNRKITSTDDLNTLFHIAQENVGANLLLDLSLFNDDCHHPALNNIFKKCNSQLVVVFTQTQTPENLYTLFQQGCRGFLDSTIDDEQLIKAIKAIEIGELWINRKLIAYFMKKLLIEESANNTDAFYNGGLTARETQVIDCVAQGKCDKIIARELSISPNTVKNHLSHIFSKLNISDRLQLALLYHGIKIK